MDASSGEDRVRRQARDLQWVPRHHEELQGEYFLCRRGFRVNNANLAASIQPKDVSGNVSDSSTSFGRNPRPVAPLILSVQTARYSTRTGSQRFPCIFVACLFFFTHKNNVVFLLLCRPMPLVVVTPSLAFADFYIRDTVSILGKKCVCVCFFFCANCSKWVEARTTVGGNRCTCACTAAASEK